MSAIAVVENQPGSVVPERNQDPRIAALTLQVGKELRTKGFTDLCVEQIFVGEGTGQCTGITGTFPVPRADELVDILRRFSDTNPPCSLAWVVNRSAGRVYLWE